MITFERECEERFRRDLDAQIMFIREEEIKKLRLEEKSLARTEMDVVRRELEKEYSQRLALYAQREEELSRSALEREKASERSLYEGRQQMLREMEDVRLKEQAAAKKNEIESQGLRILESRLHEAQAASAAKERELGQMERELNDKLRSCSRIARDEVTAQLSSELEAAVRDKASIRQERERFEDEKLSQGDLIAASAKFHQRLREAQGKPKKPFSGSFTHPGANRSTRTPRSNPREGSRGRCYEAAGIGFAIAPK